MEIVLKQLQNKGIKLNNLHTVEVFGRTGEWHTKVYADKVKSLEIWEIDSEWKKQLKKNFPNAKIRIIDSIKLINESTNLPKYDFIIVDNPQNLFRSTKLRARYCEHFEVLTKIDRLIDNYGIIVFNVNPKPFDYEKWPLWKKRREDFYNINNTEEIEINFLTNFYVQFFNNIGLKTIFHFYVKRLTPNPKETIYYFTYFLTKK